jgi:hypothetical protein
VCSSDLSGATFGYMLDTSVSPMLMLCFVFVAQIAAIALLLGTKLKKKEQ